jgi:hypothetical protein
MNIESNNRNGCSFVNGRFIFIPKHPPPQTSPPRLSQSPPCIFHFIPARINFTPYQPLQRRKLRAEYSRMIRAHFRTSVSNLFIREKA